MIHSIQIQNYRNLKDLKIPSLGQVNLITGKNNTGKTSFLEAVGVYIAEFDLSFISELLEDRGDELDLNILGKKHGREDIIKSYLNSLSSFFNSRKTSIDQDNLILIGQLEKESFDSNIVQNTALSIRFVTGFQETQSIDFKQQEIFESLDLYKNREDIDIGLQIRVGERGFIMSLSENFFMNSYFPNLYKERVFQFIRSGNFGRKEDDKHWDNITLTEKEKYVIEAIQIIEPTIERLAFISKSQRKRSPVVKLLDNKEVLPLKSMGDGINRILTIILAMVNVDNGYLLIDEFENGLHYTTQEKLWKVIFHLAKTLNIQVFATTHSRDCIASFEKVLNEPENQVSGNLIRLENKNGDIRQVEYNAEELQIAVNQNIETR